MARALSNKAVVVRQIPWLEDEDNVVLLPPYFGMGIIGRILQAICRNPTKRFRLDGLGSHIWKLCDGATSIESILGSLDEALAVKAGQARAQVEELVLRLHRQRWISFIY